MTADPIFEQLLAAMRDREEDLRLQRLSAYAGAAATVVALLAMTFSPFGHPVAVFLVAEAALCTAAGLGVAEYVLRRGGNGLAKEVAARNAVVLMAGRTEENA